MVLGGNGEKRANLPAFSNWRRKGWLAVDLSFPAAEKLLRLTKLEPSVTLVSVTMKGNSEV